jgi:predicted transcriptional regulator
VTTLETLHALIDALPDSSLEHACRTLTELRDDPWEWIHRYAEIDDEEYTDEERAGWKQAEAEIRAGNFVSNEEVGRMLAELCAKLPGQLELSSSS